MDNDAFEKQMRSLEYFHTLRLLPGAWVVLRVDGRGFSRFTESRFEKPFDLEFHRVMVQTASALLEELYGIYAYTESDEISVSYLPGSVEGWGCTGKNTINKATILFRQKKLWLHGVGSRWMRNCR